MDPIEIALAADQAVQQIGGNSGGGGLPIVEIASNALITSEELQLPEEKSLELDKAAATGLPLIVKINVGNGQLFYSCVCIFSKFQDMGMASFFSFGGELIVQFIKEGDSPWMYSVSKI